MKYDRFNYDLNEIPCMNFRGISKFLGKPPLARKTAKTWNTFNKVFGLYWSRDDKGSGRTQKYHRGYLKVLDLLSEIDGMDSPNSLSNRLIKKIRTLVEYYCSCLPATSQSRLIAPIGSSMAWLAFCRDGRQDGHAESPDSHPEQDNSWARIRMSFKCDRMFSLSAREVVEIETIEQLIAQRRIVQFRSYDGTHKELTSYQDDQSARTTAAEIRNARENQKRQRERSKAEDSKPHLILQGRMRARELEEERKIAKEARKFAREHEPYAYFQQLKRARELGGQKNMDEEKRELQERLIRNAKRARKVEEEEKQLRAQKNYRIIRERFTPAQIFQRKFPQGRPSKLDGEDDSDDPLGFRNLRKAAKRGRWEIE